MNTKPHSKTWIWVTVVVIVAAIGYFYFYGSSSAVPASTGLIQSSGTDSSGVGSDVLTLLNQIQAFTIDTSIFSDSGYKTLRDYSVVIPPVNVGRPNPFAPIPGFLPASSGSAPVTH